MAVILANNRRLLSNSQSLRLARLREALAWGDEALLLKEVDGDKILLLHNVMHLRGLSEVNKGLG